MMADFKWRKGEVIVSLNTETNQEGYRLLASRPMSLQKALR
jgi:hypothetical protein